MRAHQVYSSEPMKSGKQRLSSRCPVCDSTEFGTILQVPDPLAPDIQSFELIQCVSCGLVHTEPILSLEELNPYYDSEYWYQESPGAEKVLGQLIRRLERWFLDYRLGLSVRPLRKYVPPNGRVLDVGCGSGDMLSLLTIAGYDAYGVEISEHAAEYAQRVRDAEVFCGTLEGAAYPKEFFDSVTLYHVLEHLHSPQDMLREVRRILKPGGLVLIEVPNIESLGFRIFADRWQPLHIPQHLYHFSPNSLKSLLTKLEFQVINISHFSARASCAAWVLSLFPSIHPRDLRKREIQGKGTILLKILYFGLQTLVLPLAVGGGWLKKGDIISVAAVRRI